MSDIRQQVRTFIEQNFLVASTTDLGDSDSLLQLQVVDSTGFLELIHFIEATFAVQVADEEMVPENLETVDNIVEFVGRKRAA